MEAGDGASQPLIFIFLLFYAPWDEFDLRAILVYIFSFSSRGLTKSARLLFSSLTFSLKDFEQRRVL